MDRMGDHHPRAAACARSALSPLCAEGPRASANASRQRLEIRLDYKLRAGAIRERPAHLRPHMAHAGDCDPQPLTDTEIIIRLDAATIVGKVRQRGRNLASIEAVHDRIDDDRITVLSLGPLVLAVH